MTQKSHPLLVGQLAHAFARFAPSLVVPGLVNLLLYPLIGRLLPRDDLGVFALASGIVAFAPILCSNWLEAAILRFGYQDGQALDRRDQSRATAAALAASGVTTALLVAVAVRPDPELVVSCALMGIVSVAFMIGLAPLRAVGAFGRYSLLIGARSVLGLPCALIGAAAFGVPGAIVGLHGPQLLLLLISRTRTAPETTVPLAQAVKYGLPVASMNVAASVLSIADRYILSFSQPIGAVAVYVATYVTMEQLLRFVPAAISAAIAPTVYRTLAAGDGFSAGRILVGASVVTIAADAIILAGLVVLSPVWLAALGSGFDAASGIVAPLGFGMVAHGVNQIMAVRYTALTQVGGLAINVGLAVVINIALNVALVPTFGILAAAWATAISYSCLLALNIGQALLRSGLSPQRRRMTPRGDMLEEQADAEAQRLRAAYARRGTPELRLAGNEGQQRIVQERDQAIRSILRECGPVDRLLDIGCGDGSVLGALHSEGFARTGVGLDLLAERIDAARSLHPDLEFIVGDGSTLPFDSASFDAVLTMTVFSSIPRHKQRMAVLREAARVLRPGGVLVWYDMRRKNPNNPDVSPLSVADVRTVFGSDVRSRTLTLLPPLARRLGRFTGLLYPLLVSFPALRTHTAGRARVRPR